MLGVDYENEPFFREDGDPKQYAKRCAAYEKAKKAFDAKYPHHGEDDGSGFCEMTARELLDKPFPPSRVSYDDAGISLHVYEGTNTYDIAWDDIRSAKDILTWVLELTSMVWCDAELVHDFILCCTHYRKNIKVLTV